LITSSINDRQQRNRAFAAEFLAPASLIAKSVSGSPVTIAEVADIAQDFGVSPHVIEHQIKNHGIGHVLKEFAVVA
jgi:Zn-dependent peptidase ImmA (M78 family)